MSIRPEASFSHEVLAATASHSTAILLTGARKPAGDVARKSDASSEEPVLDAWRVLASTFPANVAPY